MSCLSVTSKERVRCYFDEMVKKNQDVYYSEYDGKNIRCGNFRVVVIVHEHVQSESHDSLQPTDLPPTTSYTHKQ